MGSLYGLVPGLQSTDKDTMSQGLARFGKEYFVRWDNSKTGGRWFEASIGQEFSDGTLDVMAHDGDRKNFPKSSISYLGMPTQLGDSVISYWGNRAYAFKGKHAGTHLNGQIWVEYDDGDKAWTDATRVHKLVTIDKQ